MKFLKSELENLLFAISDIWIFASINEGTSQTHGFKFKTVTFTETKVLGNKQIKTNTDQSYIQFKI